MAGYIRVSDVGGRDGERYASPTLQRQAIEQAAERLGENPGEVIVEEDVSGAKRPEERGLEHLIAKRERGESNGIIVSNIDRLSRGSLRETAAIYERLDKAGARLVAALDGVDSVAPGAELNLGVLAVIARANWRRYQANWEAARKGAVARGAYPTKTPGATTATMVGGSSRMTRLRSSRRCSRGGHGGATISELAGFLADVPPPTKNRATGSWSHSTIAQILRNSAYTGTARHGEYEKADAHFWLGWIPGTAMVAAGIAMTPTPGGDEAGWSLIFFGGLLLIPGWALYFFPLIAAGAYIRSGRAKRLTPESSVLPR